MIDAPRIDRVRFRPAPPAEVATGLLGWTRFLLDGRWSVGGVAVRRLTSGQLGLSFPSRKDARGHKHPLLHPVDRETRRAAEEVILLAIKPELVARGLWRSAGRGP